MSKLERVIVVCCALVILVHLGASFFSHLRLWGINQLHYFPLGFRIALATIGVVILARKVNTMVVNILARVLMPLVGMFGKLNKWAQYSVISLLGLIPFWFVRSKTPLLGDGYLRAGELKLGSLQSITEPLDFYLHLLLFKLLGLDGYTTYAVLSCFAGALYLFIILFLCDLHGKDGKEKLFIFSILTTLGAIQLFFGYVESYSFMFAALTGYILFSLRYLQAKTRFLWPCFFLLLAAGFHLSALFVFPSLWYLAFVGPSESSKPETWHPRFTRIVILVCLTSVTGLALYLLRTHSSDRTVSSFLIYPFGGGESSYSFFSSAHLLDFPNHQLLLSPVGPVLLLALLLFFRSRSVSRESWFKFLGWVTLCSLTFALFVDPKLGYARDWDLFAFAALGVSLLAAFLLVNVFRTLQQAVERTKGRVMDLSRVTLVLFVASLVSSLPWVCINASEDRSVARFGHLLEIDKQRAAYGYEIMACYFRDQGRHSKALESWRRAVAINPLPRYFAALGGAYSKLGRYDQAIQAFSRSIELEPGGPAAHKIHRRWGHCLAKTGRYDEAVDHLKKAIHLKPDNAEYHYALGNILGSAGRYGEAVPHFEMVLRLDPGKVTVYRKLGMCYAKLGNKEEAKKYLEAYLSSAPIDAPQTKRMIDSIEIEMESDR